MVRVRLDGRPRGRLAVHDHRLYDVVRLARAATTS